jgi:DNA modification methylase
MIHADISSAKGGSLASLPAIRNTVVQGDCVRVMKRMASGSVDFILTDPPYLCRYRSRDGRSVRNDNNAAWLKPASAEMYRVLKDGSFCLSFFGWDQPDVFISAWKAVGFRIVGHIVFRKPYVASTKYLKHQHEVAYLLAKGDVSLPDNPPSDVVDWVYTGNRLHPTQKPVSVLKPFIEAFCPTRGVVLDPFCGSGSTLVAAKDCGRGYIGIELDRVHHRTAASRCGSRPTSKGCIAMN